MNREDYAKLFPSIQGLSTSNQIGVYRNKANIFKKSIPKKKKKKNGSLKWATILQLPKNKCDYPCPKDRVS